MNHFEYTVEVPVTEAVEKATNDIYNSIKEGRCLFNLCKVVDEGDDDKKTRTFVITSPANIHHIIHPMFSNYGMKVQCYFKSFVSF